MNKGIFYGVGVGPGDPELLTLKAVRAIEHCDIIATPKTGGEKTLALDIARGEVDFSRKTIIELDFLMIRDKVQLQKNHAENAMKIIEYLERGQDVAMLNLGDISIYSTFSYILEIICEHGFDAVLIAGVPSFCAVAAKLQTSLTEMKKPLHIIPAGHDCLEESLDLMGTKILMKTGSALPKVKQELRARGIYEKASLVQNCGLANEKICKSLDDADEDAGYFTTIIVKD